VGGDWARGSQVVERGAQVERTALMVNLVAAEEANNHAWSDDAELAQICSSTPCGNQGGDMDTLKA